MAQSSLLVRFVPYAQRDSKNLFFLRWNSFHSLWWDVADSEFLQQTQAALPDSKTSDHSAEKLSLSSLRTHRRTFVYNYHGTQATQQDRYSPIQWSLLGDVGVGSIPRSIHTATVFKTPVCRRYSQTGSVARQFEEPFIFITALTYFYGIRCRLDGHRHLWKTGRIPYRIQPQETRTSFLPSLVLFRSSLSRILAWVSETRRYGRCYRRHSFSSSLSGQSPQDYCQKPCSVPNGFGILWSKNHSFSGLYRLRIRDRGQRVFHHQSPRPNLSVHSFEKWMGSRRIQRQNSSKMGQTPSLCCRAASYSRGPCRSQSTHFVQRQKIRLPCFCYQPQNISLAGLFVLQPQSYDRKEQQGIPLRLPHGENSNSFLDRQCRFLSTHPLCRQSRSLVQTIMSSKRISPYNPRHDSHRFPLATGSIDQPWKQKSFTSPSRLSLPHILSAGISKNKETEVSQKFPFLQVNDFMASSIL